MTDYFRADNTEGFTTAELTELNARVADILSDCGISEDDPLYGDAIKNACDQASDQFATAHQ